MGMIVDSKLVSVIVLNLNGEKILRRCLDHLLNQSYRNFEIIVVDNGSTDGSVAVLEEYLKTDKLSVVRAHKNLGVPGGRNLGLLHVRGEIIAYMDNDGSANSRWLEEAVRTLESDEKIGAVAPVVFFAKKKIVLNGAGATMNFQGYGADFSFNAPYEFARFSHEVLYSMAIGMVIRKSAMDQCGPLDPLLIKWYEDAELGIRLWKLGFRVIVSPNAWVDHDIGHSDQFLPDKIYLCEKARIRTVLKYYPMGRLPSWLVREVSNARRYGKYCWAIPVKAWLWNLVHLGSALRWRFRFRFAKEPFWHLVHPSWGVFPPPTPDNRAFQPDLAKADSHLILEGRKDLRQLNFGWYEAERDELTTYRWTDAQASAFFHLTAPARSVVVALRGSLSTQRVRLMVRRAGELVAKSEMSIMASFEWGVEACPVNLEGGLYELIIEAGQVCVDRLGRKVGVAVSAIEFR
jgi:GT2 family glycosyltransferase